MLRPFFFTIIMMFLVTNSKIVFSDVVALHSGNNNPTSEGWNAIPGSGGSVVVGPITDSGTAAWMVDDNSTALNTIYLYENILSAGDIAVGNSNGWILETNLRIASDESLSFDGSPVVAYRDGVTSWQMNFGLNSSGDTVVRLYTSATTGPTFTVSGNSVFNSFSLVFDPNSADADLFVNGTEVISNYSGFSSTQTRVLWGAGTSADSGQGNFNLVSFSTVPEPSSLVVLALIMNGFLFRRLRG